MEAEIDIIISKRLAYTLNTFALLYLVFRQGALSS